VVQRFADVVDAGLHLLRRLRRGGHATSP
jgi:hypothetical protein